MKEKKKPSVLIRLLKETKAIAGWMVLAGILCIIGVGLDLLGPELLGKVIDLLYDYWSGISPLDMHIILVECLALGGIYVGHGVFEWLKMYILNNAVSKHFTCAIRIRLSDKITRMSVGSIDKIPNGEMISKMMHDVSTLGNSVHSFLDILITGIFKLIAIAVIVLVINPILAIPVLAFVPISLLISGRMAKSMGKHFGELRKCDDVAYSIAEEDYSGFETVRAFNLSGRQNREHTEAVDKMSIPQEKAFRVSNLLSPVIGAASNIAYILICLIGGYMAAVGTIPIGEVVTFIIYAKMFAVPLQSIAQGFGNVQMTLASARRVYELMDSEEMEESKEKMPNDIKGAVTLENVCFSYDEKHPLIENLNVCVEPGQKVAIVGPTGGGKTTIVNLLMRFYDPTDGRILVDGYDTKEKDRASVRGLFGMVLQDTWLFSGTIYDNIAYGNEGATKEQIEEAARKAHLDHFIETLPDGYNTMINEESSNISGGQKQLLTIARAYLSNRKMLILDEATSNVDTRTELLIQQTMDELMKGRTSFVIAHRLSTIVDADVILVVNNGKIVESGTHEALMAKKGFYSEIYNSQYALIS